MECFGWHPIWIVSFRDFVLVAESERERKVSDFSDVNDDAVQREREREKGREKSVKGKR